MVYTLTYSNIHESEVSIIGKRALFLANASRKSLNSCLFFVVTGTSFKEFVDFNSLDKKIVDLLNAGLPDDYFWDELKNLFSASSLPSNILVDIKDSYDALSVSISDANNILRSFEPTVNLFLSSQDDCGLEEVFLNIKGFDNVVNALKSCWFLFFKKLGFDVLKSGDFDFSAGVVVEKFISSDFTVEVEGSSDESNLVVNVYKGLPEVSQGIVKDVYVLSFNHLEFVNYELNHQNFSILHQEGSGMLLKKRLGKEGSDNKASKQLVSECARLAKRIFSLVNKFVRVIFVVKQNVPYLFLVDDCSSSVESPVESSFESSVESSVVSDVVNRDIPNVVSDTDPEVILGNVGSIRDESFLSKIDNSSDFVSEDMASEVVSDSNSDIVSSESDVVSDVDEFIVQEGQSIGSSENDNFSSFFNLVEVLEDNIIKSYKDSFGFSPSSVDDAIFELDSKHGFIDKDKILRVLEVKSLLIRGEKVDEDIIYSVIGVMEDFLKRESE